MVLKLALNSLYGKIMRYDNVMGFSGRGFQVIALLDEHGGDLEKRERELWDELTTRLAEIAREDKYESIVVTISNDNE